MKNPAEQRREKLQNFFSTPEDNVEFSQLMRKFIFEASMLALKAEPLKITPDTEVISEGCIFLNELCEVLDEEMATHT